MRAFIAIELPDDVKDILVALVERLRRSDVRASWVKRDAMHLTLRFLGEIDEHALSDIVRSLEEGLKDARSFELRVAGVGGFPNVARPGTVWAGVHPVEGPLTSTYRVCETAARSAGLPPESKPFRPHLTVARLKRAQDGVHLRPYLEQEDSLTSHVFKVPSVVLFQSDLTPRGPIHTPLREFRLHDA